MGEQSKESEPDEAVSYPFVRSAVEYDATTRLQMAETVASSRRLFVSPALKEIIVNPENFFHDCQQSAKMAEDANQRRQMSFNTKREAYIKQRRTEELPLPSKIPMIEINPTRVTLSLEFESQYYSLMTNDYGDHENVASIMKETNTLIQLPDRSGEGASPDPFAQQVTITGLYSNVDRARKLLRDNCHVSVIMSLAELKISKLILQKFVEQNPIQNVEMFFIDCPPDTNGKMTSHLRFTSRAKNQQELIIAANMILKKVLESGTPHEDIFSLHFTLSTFHVEHVIGNASTTLLMPIIESCTRTKIMYPSHNTRDKIRENIIVIKIIGTVDAILKARKYIMDLLPVSMCFNMKNTDMAVQSGNSDRHVHSVIDECRTILKMTPSVYEPSELLSGEVPLHCASLRSKEFNIKHMYSAYQKVLAKKIDVIAPEPEDYDGSIWHRSLPSNFFSFPVPCRGESSDSTIHHRRQRSYSTASIRSKQSYASKGKSCSESSEIYSTRASAHSESPAVPFLIPSYQDCPTPLNPYFMMQQAPFAAFMKGNNGFPHMTPIFGGGPFVFDPIVYHFVHVPPDVQGALPVEAGRQVSSFPATTEVDHTMGRQELPTSLRPHQSNRKPTRVNRPASAATSHYQSRVYDQAKEDDSRSSPRGGSRRTSISCDESLAGSLEERGYDRQFQRQYQRLPKDEALRWKTGSRGDIHAKRNISHPRDYRGVGTSRDNDVSIGSPGSSERPSSTDHGQFQRTHHLKLKPNDIDLEHERLFTHDSPQVEEQIFTPGSYGNELMDGDFVQRLLSSATLNDSGKRSRAVSCYMERDDQSTGFNDSDCGYSVTDQAVTHPSRSIDSFKKIAVTGVTKTMLEPRYRNERDYGKISLEHRDKYCNEQNDGEKYTENGSSLGTRQYRIDPMKLIAHVRESSEQLPRIHERQFNDVLNDKERELAASSFKGISLETTIVQEASLDETSPMDYAFRNEQSSENLQ